MKIAFLLQAPSADKKKSEDRKEIAIFPTEVSFHHQTLHTVSFFEFVFSIWI